MRNVTRMRGEFAQLLEPEDSDSDGSSSSSSASSESEKQKLRCAFPTFEPVIDEQLGQLIYWGLDRVGVAIHFVKNLPTDQRALGPSFASRMHCPKTTPATPVRLLDACGPSIIQISITVRLLLHITNPQGVVVIRTVDISITTLSESQAAILTWFSHGPVCVPIRTVPMACPQFRAEMEETWNYIDENVDPEFLSTHQWVAGVAVLASTAPLTNGARIKACSSCKT